MYEEISRALAVRPASEGLDQDPALTGLSRRCLSARDVLAPSLAATKPAAAALVAPVLLTAYVGPGAWLSVVLAVAVALLLRSVIDQFTSRVVSAGSLYTFVVRGLGAFPGLVCAVAMLLGYAFAVGYALTTTGITARSLGSRSAGVTGSFQLLDVLVVAAVGIGCGLVLVRRVSTFTRATLTIQVITVAGVLLLAVLLLLDAPGLVEPLSLEGADPVRVAGGASIVLALMAGFEASVALGAEAGRPFRTVPRAMTTSILVTGTLCLLTTVTLSADPAATLESLQRSVQIEGVWFPDSGAVVAVIFRAVRMLSLVACVLALWAVMARLVFTLALEGALPSFLRRTSEDARTPMWAVVATSPLVIVPGALLVAGGHPRRTVIASMLDTSGLVLLIGYLLVCLAAPAFLRRLGEDTWFTTALAGAAAAVVVGAMCANVWLQQERGDTPVVGVTALLVVPLAAAWYLVLRRRRPEALARMGVHDRSIAADAWTRP